MQCNRNLHCDSIDCTDSKDTQQSATILIRDLILYNLNLHCDSTVCTDSKDP